MKTTTTPCMSNFLCLSYLTFWPQKTTSNKKKGPPAHSSEPLSHILLMLRRRSPSNSFLRHLHEESKLFNRTSHHSNMKHAKQSVQSATAFPHTDYHLVAAVKKLSKSICVVLAA